MCSSVTSFVSSAEVEYKGTTTQRSETGNGVIMEFEHDQTEAQNNKKAGTEEKQSEVEFIIGGQSVDGVAKRGQLKITK